MDPRLIFLPGRETVPAVEGHAHTSYTDGKNSLEEMCEAALKAGLEAIVFTEHVNRSSDWFWDFFGEVKEAKKFYRTKLRVFSGIEAKALNWWGELDATPEMKEAADVVMGVVHSYTDKDGNKLAWDGLNLADAIRLETSAALGLLHRKEIDVLGHLGGTCSKHFGPYPLDITKGVIKDAAAKGIAFEINCRHHPVYRELLVLCSCWGCKAYPGSDAHSSNEVGSAYKKIKEQGSYDSKD